MTVLLIFLLACSFLMILLCSQSSNRLLNKYPATIDCAPIMEGRTNDDLQTSAIIEWTSLTAAEEKGQAVSYKGHVQCFCDKMDSEENNAADQEYGDDGLMICQDYQHSKLTTFFATNGITLIITAINKVLGGVSISLITWIGYDTHSQMLTKITNGVFAAQFFNTAILILLVYANLEEVNESAGKLLDGQFRDYSPRWYTLVGNNIVQAMFINAFMPIISETIPIIVDGFKRSVDRGFCMSRDSQYATKQTQIYSYIDLYVGPDYQIHFKYSGILNVTFVTMMYGLGMPILFPIAAVSYFILYAVERYQVAFTYPMPPALDDQMTKNALGLLSYSPILLLMNGYWMLSNKQIFDSELNSISTITSDMLTGHTLSTILVLDHAFPMVVIALVSLFLIVFSKIFTTAMHKWGYVISKREIVVDENLPNFFEAVTLSEADWIIAENKNLREIYGFNMMQREIEQKLDNLPAGSKYIRGVAWYQILANPVYARDFCFIEAYVPDRSDYIVDGDSDEENDCEQSDMAQVLLNFGMAPRAVVRQVTFGEGISKNFKEEVNKQFEASWGNLHPKPKSSPNTPSKEINRLSRKKK